MNMTKLYTVLFLFAAATVLGQQKQVQASIDSVKIKIGAQATLTLRTTVDTAARVSFPEGKTFGRVEVLESYPVDTTRNGAMYELVKKYGLTQFDSGRYVIPPLPVTINNKIMRTDSLTLEVRNISVDTLKQKMFDIKPVLRPKADTAFWLWLLLGIALTAGAAFGIWWYLKKRKAAPAEIEEVFVSPIQKATTQLKRLEKKELLQKGEVKDYYSELTDIARTYIEEAIHVPAMESTTSELIEAMRIAVMKKKMALSQETFEQLEKVLRNADMVKFAKSRPMESEIAEDRSRIEKTIVVIDRSIPEEKEEDDLHTDIWLEQQRKKKEQQRRKKIIWSAIGAGFVVAVVLGLTVGKDFMQEHFTGYPTKALLQGEWVKSEYGNPGVTVETPKVLHRIDRAKMGVPKETMALIKDMSRFTYGAMHESLYVEVATISYKEETEVNLQATLDGVVKLWESYGAQNILLKTEEFATPNGITGLRSFGNMSLPDPITKKPIRTYYELFFFRQQGGLQQVVVTHHEGDQAGAEILEKIKNSIELRTGTHNL